MLRQESPSTMFTPNDQDKKRETSFCTRRLEEFVSMQKQRRSITIKIEDDGDPKKKFDPTPYLEAYIQSLRDKSQCRDPDAFTPGLHFFDKGQFTGVMLNAEATWISTLSPFQASLGRLQHRTASRIRIYAGACHWAGKKIGAKIAAVIPAMK